MELFKHAKPTAINALSNNKIIQTMIKIRNFMKVW